MKQVERAGRLAAVLVVLFIFTGLPIPAQEEGDHEDLAKAAQNPVEAMISLPFQNNTNFGIGPDEEIQNVLNIQPVIPFSGKKWNLITRYILPVIYQPNFDGRGGTFGLGDFNPTVFISPAKPGKLIWGIGPTFILPTATDKRLGTDKWSGGPSVVLLTMPGNWVVGCLASNYWSFAGSGNRPDVNQFVFQYFLNYNLPKGWYLTSAPIITANWEAESGQKWTVPFGMGFGRVFAIGRQPVNMSLHAYYNVERPDYASDWGIRFALVFLFPKR
jgi:hypothetical protein